MAIAQTKHSEQFLFGEASANAMISPEDMPGEARLGAVLARALVQHISTMRAVGYEDEIVVDGDVWNVEVRRKSPTS